MTTSVNPASRGEAQPSGDKLLRLPQVLDKLPMSAPSWWKGVKAGRFPAPVKLGPRTTCWRQSDIDALIRSL